MNKKTIKVNFTGFGGGYDVQNNEFMDVLRKYYNVVISDTPDFLFYSVFGSEFRRYKNCVKIFWTGENIVPNFNECDYAIGFNNLKFRNRYLRHTGFMPESIDDVRGKVTKDMAQRKFCNFLYSNASAGEGCAIRKQFFEMLSQYKFVDAPGRVCHNIDLDIEPRDGDWERGKLDFLSGYKFTIAFENSNSDDYTTEKLWHPFQSMSVPIYWGNPAITEDVNPRAFINCNDYDNDFERVIERIKELDNNDELYLQMLREPILKSDSFVHTYRSDFEQFLIGIIERGNVPFNKDPLNFTERMRQKHGEWEYRLKQCVAFDNKRFGTEKWRVLTLFGNDIKLWKKKHKKKITS